MIRTIYKFSTLLLTVAISAWAAESLAKFQISPSGEVWSNSNPLTGSSEALDGDHIRTGYRGKAVLESAASGRVEIRSNSEVTLTDQRLSLQKGSLVSDGAEVLLGQFRIAPKDPGADSNLFAVADRAGKRLVAAHRGDLIISSAGAAPLLVPAGSYAMPRTSPEEDEDDDDGGGAAAGGGASGAGAKSGWTVGSLSHGQSVALVAGLGAAAVGGTVAGITLTGDSDQPVRTTTE